MSFAFLLYHIIIILLLFNQNQYLIKKKFFFLSLIIYLLFAYAPNQLEKHSRSEKRNEKTENNNQIIKSR